MCFGNSFLSPAFTKMTNYFRGIYRNEKKAEIIIPLLCQCLSGQWKVKNDKVIIDTLVAPGAPTICPKSWKW